MSSKIWLSKPHLNSQEKTFINEALESNWITTKGKQIDLFEDELASYINSSKSVVALNSGTSAIHLALYHLGVGFGDEVICQSFTFCASANPILYLGAKPIFVDSEEETWNMNPYFLIKAIKSRLKKGKKPKAIIIVNTYGMPAKWDELLEISKEYEIPIVEDAAEALGSSYKNKKCGLFGDYAIFSFNGNKIITTSSGGALVLNNYQKKEKIISLASQSNSGDSVYIHDELGFNYRMSNILAAIGRAQLHSINDRVKQRRNVNFFYRLKLEENSKIKFQNNLDDDIFYSNFWLSCISFEEGKNLEDINIIKDLFKSEQIEVRSLWKPLHTQKLYKNAHFFGNGVSDKIYKSGICLPSSSSLTLEEVSRVSEILNKL